MIKTIIYSDKQRQYSNVLLNNGKWKVKNDRTSITSTDLTLKSFLLRDRRQNSPLIYHANLRELISILPEIVRKA